MAQLKDLIVAGASRFLGKTYFEDSVTFNDTLILAKSQDLSGTADNRPALIVGGLPSESHVEIDANEIQAKSSGTSVASLYINNDGGSVILSGYVTTAADGNDATSTSGGALRITGGLSTTKASYFGGAITAASTLGVSGKTTLSGEALLKGATKIENTLNVTKAADFDSTVNIDGKLTLGDNIAYQNGSYTNYDVIKFLTGDDNGAGVVIGGGGVAIFGSGESASNLATAASISGTSETTYITSDNNIEFYTNCQTIGDRVGVILNTSRYFYPNVNSTGSLGTSGNVWNSLYVNTANINGNATVKGSLVVNGTTTLKGTLTLGTYVNQATVPSDGGIIVMDLRDATITPDSFGDRRVNFYFDQITDDFYTTTSATSPSSATKWMGILHVKGWKDSTYAAWELAGNADTTSVQDTLRFRQGIGSTWGAWQSVITDANMNQYMDGRYVNVTGDSMTGHLYMTGSHATSSTSNTSQIVMGTATTQHFALTANDKAVVFNPSTTNTEHQIVLYLKSGTQSIFPNGISVGGVLSTSTGSDASGSTGSGDLRVAGGAGIAKKLYVGSNLSVGGTATITSNLDVNGEAYFAKHITLDGDQNRDQWINFLHTGSETGYDWRIGHQGTGSGDTNYFVIQSNSTSGTWANVLRLGLTSYAAVFGGTITSGGNITPGTTSSYTLGTSSYYWNNLYTNVANVGNGTDSSSTTTGALIVNGGVGISKKLYVGTNLTVNGNATLGDATSDTHKINGNTTFNGILYFANGTTYYINASASAKFSGLNVAGNAAVTGTMNIGGNTTIGDATSDSHKVNGNMTHNGHIYLANGTTYYINSSGSANIVALTTNGAVTMNGNTASNSMTTGQLIINGGAGMSGQLNAKSVRIDNAVKFEYNSTDKCVDIIFG